MKTINYITIIIFTLGIISSCKNRSEKGMMNANYKQNIEVTYPTTDSVLLSKTYPGYLTSKAKVDLVARVNGFLTKSNITAGSKVRKGDLIFVIEPVTYIDAVKQAEANLNEAHSQYEYALENYKSIKEAAESNAVSQIDLIKAQNILNQSDAAISSAEAALSTAETNLSYCYIRAPFDGHINDAKFDVGAYLNGAISPVTLATIYDDSTLNAYFSIEDSQYIRLINHSDKASEINLKNIPILFNAPLPHEYFSELNYVAPYVDLSTGTLTMRTIVDNKYGELKSGMYVNIKLPYAEMPNATLVRDASIGTDQLGKYLYVINDSNKVEYTPIKIGELYQDSLRIVLDGITPKDKYVTKALLKLREGMEVNPIIKK
ncbi:MAG: efflux RND transporter periplasmic adaptor subunit [Bacteroidales bacterium]